MAVRQCYRLAECMAESHPRAGRAELPDAEAQLVASHRIGAPRQLTIELASVTPTRQRSDTPPSTKPRVRRAKRRLGSNRRVPIRLTLIGVRPRTAFDRGAAKSGRTTADKS